MPAKNKVNKSTQAKKEQIQAQKEQIEIHKKQIDDLKRKVSVLAVLAFAFGSGGLFGFYKWTTVDRKNTAAETKVKTAEARLKLIDIEMKKIDALKERLELENDEHEKLKIWSSIGGHLRGVEEIRSETTIIRKVRVK